MKSKILKIQKNGLLLTLLALFTGAHQATAQSFVLSSSPVIGADSHCVVATDVNGDGNLDLISVDYGFGAGTLTVLTNDGHGTFTACSTNATATQPFWATAADLIGNSNAEIVTANYNADTLTVLTNNGYGAFGSNATYNVPDSPVYVMAVDVNGDGKLDLITANVGNSVTVLTNNGDGTLTFSSTYTVGNSPINVVAADVNGDGKLDLVAANSDNTLTVLTNNGNGTFTFSSTQIVGYSPFVTAADVNNDGKVDLITANYSDDTVTVLTNNGSGRFTTASTSQVGFSPYSVTTTDLNGDGKVDLVIANQGGNGDGGNGTLTLLANNGKGTFLQAGTLSVGNGPVFVATADVNGDGAPDLIAVNQGDSTLSILLNQSIPSVFIESLSARSASIYWTGYWPGYVLQQNSSLNPATWVNTVNPTGTNQVTISTVTGNKFFRLRHK